MIIDKLKRALLAPRQPGAQLAPWKPAIGRGFKGFKNLSVGDSRRARNARRAKRVAAHELRRNLPAWHVGRQFTQDALK